MQSQSSKFSGWARNPKRTSPLETPASLTHVTTVVMRPLLLSILERSASESAMAWLRDQLDADFSERAFYFAFSGVSRHFDRSRIVEPTEDDNVKFLVLDHGFSLNGGAGWDEFRLARVILLTQLREQPLEVFTETLERLLGTADFREQVAIFSAFPIFSGPDGNPDNPELDDLLVELARDGLRSNIVDVFDSIALDNPFPARQFSDDAWNQVVLKAIFTSRPLYRLHRIDDRANLKLAEALSNYAHERWAADRWVTPELWRSCAPFITDQIAEDIIKVAQTDEPGQREAAALVVAGDETRRTDPARNFVTDLLDEVGRGELTWDSLGSDFA